MSRIQFYCDLGRTRWAPRRVPKEVQQAKLRWLPIGVCYALVDKLRPAQTLKIRQLGGPAIRTDQTTVTVVRDGDLRTLPKANIRGFLPIKIAGLLIKMKMFLVGLIHSIRNTSSRQENIAQRGTFENRSKQKIVAYIDLPDNAANPQEIPWVIIPPAYGKTKETSFLLALYLKKNGFGVMRYDDTNSRGESDGEIFDLTLSKSTENILDAVDYLSATYSPKTIGLMPFSLSARTSIKAASLDARIKFMFAVVGGANVESMLHRGYGENLVGDYVSGKRRGVINMLGHIVDSDHFLKDAVDAGFADITSTKNDMEKVEIPIVWFCGENDPWIDQAEVEQIITGGNPSDAVRQLHIFKGLSHRIREAGVVPNLFAEIVRRSLSLVKAREVSAAEINHPSQAEMIERGFRERSVMGGKVSKSEDVQKWGAYLDGFDFFMKTRFYLDYLELLWQSLNLKPGDKMLDAGCGNGNLVQYCLGKMVFGDQTGWGQGEIVGIDFVPEALQRAREKVAEITVKRADLPTVSLEQIDIVHDQVPNKYGEFNAVVASLLVPYVEEPKQVIAKLCTSLKKGGIIILTSPKPDADFSQLFFDFMQGLGSVEEGERGKLLEQARELLNSATGFIETEEERGRFKFLSMDELTQALAENGVKVTFNTLSFGDQVGVVVGQKK